MFLCTDTPTPNSIIRAARGVSSGEFEKRVEVEATKVT